MFGSRINLDDMRSARTACRAIILQLSFQAAAPDSGVATSSPVATARQTPARLLLALSTCRHQAEASLVIQRGWRRPRISVDQAKGPRDCSRRQVRAGAWEVSIAKLKVGPGFDLGIHATARLLLAVLLQGCVRSI